MNNLSSCESSAAEYSLSKRTYLKTILLFVILSTAQFPLFAQNTILTSNQSEEFIGKNVLIFQDSTAKLGFNQILKSDSLFKTNDFDVPNLGISKNNNWLKFKIRNDSGADKIILNLSNPIINKVDLYIIRNNKIELIKSDNFSPTRNRYYTHQFYLFDINLQADELITCYVNLRSNEQILAPISLHSENQLISVTSNSDARTGLYIGIMMVMLLYNLFIYFTVRDKDYLVYCHYIFWVCLTQATLLGFSHRFLWTDNVWLAQNMVIVCGAMSGIATILFSKSFLKTKIYSRRLNIALNFTIVLYLIALVLLFLDLKQAAFQLVNLTAATVSLLIMYVAWFIYRKKYTPAKYFLISWSVFFVSILIFVSKDYGIVPYNQFTVHAVEIGSALEAIFLSFALASKINILKKEKETSQAEALAAAQENERIIKEQNIILEQKVQERTVELVSTNEELSVTLEDLSVTLEDLKETQTQLVASEKMASLGQLTAGIAHEINNPINFVTSNVSPLSRDVNMLLDALENIENIGLSNKPVEVKRQEIDDYKEELDFDYLKVEISHLLSGILDGASRTAEIVKGLRVFSRLDEDDLKKADINEGLDSTLVIMNSLLNSSSIKLVREYGEIPLAECYPGKLNQVFLNLISNAIHAISKSTQANNGELTIITSSDDENIYVTIKDNGSGMDEITKHKIFDPFFTTKDVGEGTGLGMSIAFNTIKKHNGQILVNSVVGKGTEMIVQIPILHPIGA